jgi:hypothetical protein
MGGKKKKSKKKGKAKDKDADGPESPDPAVGEDGVIDTNKTNRATFLNVKDANGKDISDELKKMKEGGGEQEAEGNGFTIKRGSNSTVSAKSLKDHDNLDPKFNTISEPFKPFVADNTWGNFS